MQILTVIKTFYKYSTRGNIGLKHTYSKEYTDKLFILYTQYKLFSVSHVSVVPNFLGNIDWFFLFQKNIKLKDKHF